MKIVYGSNSNTKVCMWQEKKNSIKEHIAITRDLILRIEKNNNVRSKEVNTETKEWIESNSIGCFLLLAPLTLAPSASLRCCQFLYFLDLLLAR